jgi:hypothetical protein
MVTFGYVLSTVWFIGGILLIPFNSLTLGGLICLYFNLDYDRWQERVKALWALQIVWNLIFIYICVILAGAVGAGKGRITYDLVATHPDDYPDLNIWEYRFYYEKDGAYTPIANDSKEATPFQKTMEATGYISEEEGLDPEGLHGGKNDTSQSWLKGKFNELSEAEARAYIDRYNSTHGHENPALEYFAYPLIFAFVAPFLITFPEAVIIAIIIMILQLLGGIGGFFARFGI